MAPVVSMPVRREGFYAVLEAHLPERPPHNIGVLLIDEASGRGWVRLRGRLDDIADPADAEVLQALEKHARAAMAEGGGPGFLASLEDSLSNAVRLSERRAVQVDAFTRALDRLYDEHVEKTVIRPFETHLPLYSLRAAAGNLGEEMRADPEDWVRAPEGVRLAEDLFVAHVVGHSMEPRIPDGSLNLFRYYAGGSRQGRIWLIEKFGEIDETARFTVKRYTSRKRQIDEEQWEHEQIRLEPLNPEYQAWDAGPEDFRTVAEWIRVIE